ncbi:YdiH family protein [Serratia marcescens]|uniref:YdiH family protein n=1 Tax=Serratia marcescens TaxID=615 RepID=UPI0024C48614|nr:YdiH family protein [Serratia marcescens]MDK1707814.1 YdiH family protein [Serratia marcescens]
MEAKNLAIEYLRRTDKKMSPAEYLLELKRLEGEFSELLQVEDLEQKLKEDSIKHWKALSS